MNREDISSQLDLTINSVSDKDIGLMDALDFTQELYGEEPWLTKDVLEEKMNDYIQGAIDLKGIRNWDDKRDNEPYRKGNIAKLLLMKLGGR